MTIAAPKLARVQPFARAALVVGLLIVGVWTVHTFLPALIWAVILARAFCPLTSGLRLAGPPSSRLAFGGLAAFLSLNPAARTATVAAAATTDPNLDDTTPARARAATGAKISTTPGAAARTVHTSHLWADDNARTAASTAATARPSCSAAPLGRSPGAHH